MTYLDRYGLKITMDNNIIDVSKFWFNLRKIFLCTIDIEIKTKIVKILCIKKISKLVYSEINPMK